MPRTRFRAFAASVFLTVLTGCDNYSTPANLTAQTGATIVGSKTHNSGMMSANSHVFVGFIDGEKNVSLNITDSPIQLTAGEHDIGFGIRRSGFPLKTGEGDLKFNFQPGGAYTLVVSNPVPAVDANGQVSSWPNQCMVWLQAADGQVVTPQTPVLLQLPPDMDVPIFLPVH